MVIQRGPYKSGVLLLPSVPTSYSSSIMALSVGSSCSRFPFLILGIPNFRKLVLHIRKTPQKRRRKIFVVMSKLWRLSLGYGHKVLGVEAAQYCREEAWLCRAQRELLLLLFWRSYLFFCLNYHMNTASWIIFWHIMSFSFYLCRSLIASIYSFLSC